jgi:hypothetical protein
MTLGSIETEIALLERTSTYDRSVANIERLADLREAKRRITRGACRYFTA